jgi:hypothetical protein
MPSQFFQHLDPIYRAPRSMIEDMGFHEAQEEIFKHSDLLNIA